MGFWDLKFKKSMSFIKLTQHEGQYTSLGTAL